MTAARAAAGSARARAGAVVGAVFTAVILWFIPIGLVPAGRQRRRLLRSRAVIAPDQAFWDLGLCGGCLAAVFRRGLASLAAAAGPISKKVPTQADTGCAGVCMSESLPA